MTDKVKGIIDKMNRDEVRKQLSVMLGCSDDCKTIKYLEHRLDVLGSNPLVECAEYDNGRED